MQMMIGYVVNSKAHLRTQKLTSKAREGLGKVPATAKHRAVLAEHTMQTCTKYWQRQGTQIRGTEHIDSTENREVGGKHNGCGHSTEAQTGTRQYGGKHGGTDSGNCTKAAATEHRGWGNSTALGAQRWGGGKGEHSDCELDAKARGGKMHRKHSTAQ